MRKLKKILSVVMAVAMIATAFVFVTTPNFVVNAEGIGSVYSVDFSDLSKYTEDNYAQGTQQFVFMQAYTWGDAPWTSWGGLSYMASGTPLINTSVQGSGLGNGTNLFFYTDGSKNYIDTSGQNNLAVMRFKAPADGYYFLDLNISGASDTQAHYFKTSEGTYAKFKDADDLAERRYTKVALRANEELVIPFLIWGSKTLEVNNISVTQVGAYPVEPSTAVGTVYQPAWGALEEADSDYFTFYSANGWTNDMFGTTTPLTFADGVSPKGISGGFGLGTNNQPRIFTATDTTVEEANYTVAGKNYLSVTPYASDLTVIKFTAPACGKYTSHFQLLSVGGDNQGTYNTFVRTYSDETGELVAANGTISEPNMRDMTYEFNLDAGDSVYMAIGSWESGGFYEIQQLSVTYTAAHGDNNWTSDETNHSAVCSICNEETVAQAPHGENLDWVTTDPDNHWKECSVCGYTTTSAPHNTTSGACECGLPCTHEADLTKWYNDGNGNHYRKCSNCEAKMDETSTQCAGDTYVNKGDDGHATVCSDCETEIPNSITQHTGDFDCENCTYTKNMFNASMIVSADTINLDEYVNAIISVGGLSENFASYRLELTYDPNYLTFVDTERSGLPSDVTLDTTTSGKIIVTGYGASKVSANTKFILKFNATAATPNDPAAPTTITLDYAGFSTLENAKDKDLQEAVLAGGTQNVTVRGIYNVTLPATPNNWATGETTVEHNNSYTFTLENYYDYKDLVVMMGDENITSFLVRDGNSYTINNVTDDIVITVTQRDPVSFNVTFPNGFENGNAGTATYLTDYVYTAPADVAPGLEAGKYYTVTFTIAGVEYTDVERADNVYTIPGADIKGDIQITVEEHAQAATEVTVSVIGKGSILDTKAEKGSDVTVTLDVSDVRFSYAVTATVGGVEAELTATDVANQYKVTNVQGNVVFTVTETLIKECVVEVTPYVDLDTTSAWLIKLNVGQDLLTDLGGVYKYDGQEMFWSTKYNAYCVIVIAQTAPTKDAAEGLVTLDKEGTAKTISYEGDVNMSNKRDVNDAQLVYNIYNFKYDNFDDSAANGLNIEKFLRADYDGNGTVNVNDSTAIVEITLQ